MRTLTVRIAAFAALLAVCAAGSAWGQTPAPQAAAGGAQTICGNPVPPPINLPPAGSGPVVYLLAPCFQAQGNVSTVEPQTYLYYIQVKPSSPSQGTWVPYTEATEKTIQDDFRRLWGTGFLDNLWIDAKDYTFPNEIGRAHV